MIQNKYQLEVKTKDRTVVPLPKYECTLPAYNHEHQKADFFIFVSLHRDKNHPNGNDISRYKRAYIVGGMSWQQFEDKKVFWKKDQKDPTNGTVFWTDCWNVYIRETEPVHNIGKELQRDNCETV